jgi:hypothetical protein
MLKAGVAKADLTPPVGVRLSGYAGRVFPSMAVHDPLWACALVLDDGERRAALAGLDIIGISEEMTGKVRDVVTKSAGITPDGLLIGCSHTHSGPGGFYTEPTDQERAYWETVPAKIAEAITRAAADLVPARIGAASGWSAVGINRREMLPGGRIELGRNHFGPFDPEVGLLRVDRADGTPLAGVINYTCHGICLQFDSYMITADYPGFAKHFFEQRVKGATAVFFNGACGDVNPREAGVGHGLAGTGGFRVAERAGRHVAEQAARAWAEAETSGDISLRFARKRIDLPTNRARALKAAEEELRRAEKAAAEGPPEERTPYMTWYSPPDPESARRRVERLKEEGDAPVRCDIEAILIGSTALVGWPGEIFSELGMAVKKRSPFRPTYIVGYANGSIGYVPTPDAFPLGGYEVNTAAHLADNAGTVLVQETTALLDSLRG